jgi:hypothetical protein
MIGGALRRIVTFKSKQQFLPSNAPYFLHKKHLMSMRCFGDGERGIRTLVKVTPKQHFQCCAFNRSAISPIKVTIINPTANAADLSNYFSFSDDDRSGYTSSGRETLSVKQTLDIDLRLRP